MRPHGETTWTSGLVPMIEPEVVTSIISGIADIALVISKEGQVLGIMASPAFVPRAQIETWQGNAISTVLTKESVPKFNKRLSEFLYKEEPVLPVELNHSATDTHQEFPIRYTFHKIGTDGTILMIGRDLRPIAEMQQQLVAAQIALEKDYEAQREFDTRFRVLMASSDEITLFVNATSGRISDCNTAACNFFNRSRSDLLGASLATHFAGDGDVIRDLVDTANHEGAVSVTLVGAQKLGALQVKPVMFRSAGEQMLLCRIAPGQENQIARNPLQENLSALYRDGIDGIVFVGGDGAILSANDAFFKLADVNVGQSIKGRSLADFLGRGSVDLNVLIENAGRTGSMRLYATRLISEFGAEVAVEISTSKLSGQGIPVFALIIRDASRAEAIRAPSPQITDVDMRSVIELIGSQNLRDIVAKTTDVVEKMCIETAVELTSNNRVAAAEMLGLSRQSLYVKLRKYNLL